MNYSKPLENNLVAFIVGKIRKEGRYRMDNNTYTLGKKFECCGNTMVTVIIEGRAACVMPETEYNRIIETERKYKRKNWLRKSA